MKYSSKSKKLFTPPKVKSYDFDLSKKWYVSFYYRNPQTNLLKEFRRMDGINEIQDQTKRLQALYDLKARVETDLHNGYDPFETPLKYSGKESKASKNGVMIPLLKSTLAEVASLNKLKPKTISQYSSMIKSLELFLTEKNKENILIRDFSPQMVTDFFQRRRNMKTGKDIHGKTVYNVRNGLFRIFKYLIQKEVIENNPFEVFKPKKTHPTNQKRAFRNNEIKLMEKAMKKSNYELWIFAQIIFHCLLRPDETRNLRILDIDLDRQKITVNGEISKNRKTETVEIPNVFISTIRAYIDSLIQKGFKANAYIFSDNGIKPRAKNYFFKVHKRVQQKVGLLYSNISLYSWKHTGAVIFYNQTKDIVKLKQQIRHTDINTTLGYLHSLGAIENQEFRTEFPKTFDND